MVRGPRRPGVPRPPEPMRPKPPGLQPPRFTLVVQRCRRVRYRWRQWAWVPALAPVARWLRRSHAAVATVAVAGPVAVAVFYLPVTQGPRPAASAPVTAPARVAVQGVPAVRDVLTTSTATPASQPSGAGPSAGQVAVPATPSAGASPEVAMAATTRGPGRALAPALSGLLQRRLSQLPAIGLPTLPANILPELPLPVAQLSGAVLSQLNVAQLDPHQTAVSQVTAGLPVVLGVVPHS